MKIVLIGDSIRMGYCKYVKDALDGVAEVVYPSENCRYAEHVLRYLHEWKKKGEWGDDVDLVHWNAGLWDVLELFGDRPLTSISYYGEAIARIDKRLRMLFPKAKIVFATSTSIVEERYGKDFCRHNSTIEEYNAAAVSALANTDTVINDLYGASLTCKDEHRSDATHFNTPLGTELMGGKVLSVVCRELGIKPTAIDLESFESEKYSSDSIGY